MSDEGEKPGAALSDEAVDWVVRLSSGRATPRDRQAFFNWRKRSPTHEAAAVEAEALLRGIAETRQADRMRRGAEPLPFRPASRRFSRRTLFAGATAAAASVAAVTVGLNVLGPLSVLYADHATTLGERKRVTLADGSVVSLNTATALSVDYSGYERRIALHDGEALFEVAKDPNRPFIVAAGNSQARAVGTAFVVRRTEACRHVIVTEGMVEITIGKATPVRLEAGQRLGFGEEIEGPQVRTVDVETLTAWRRGKLIFNRRSLQSVVDELQRYRRGRIVVASDRLKILQVTGVFDLDDPDRLLRTLEETTRVQVVHLPLLTIIR